MCLHDIDIKERCPSKSYINFNIHIFDTSITTVDLLLNKTDPVRCVFTLGRFHVRFKQFNEDCITNCMYGQTAVIRHILLVETKKNQIKKPVKCVTMYVLNRPQF